MWLAAMIVLTLRNNQKKWMWYNDIFDKNSIETLIRPKLAEICYFFAILHDVIDEKIRIAQSWQDLYNAR